METPIRFYVVLIPEGFGKLETYGPFKSKAAAKSWMAQEFNDACEVAKKDGKNVRWNWNEERLGSCTIEGVGLWEIVKNS